MTSTPSFDKYVALISDNGREHGWHICIPVLSLKSSWFQLLALESDDGWINMGIFISGACSISVLADHRTFLSTASTLIITRAFTAPSRFQSGIIRNNRSYWPLDE